MAFLRANTIGWAVGDVLTSAQANALDIDHANALDKTTANDAIAGTVTFTGSGKINANQASGVISTALGGIQTAQSQGILSTTVSGISTNIQAGISPTVTKGITDGGHAGGISASVARGISDGGVVGGIAPSVAGGISDGGVAGGIAPSVASGITIPVANGLTTTAAGAIQYNGGLLDYPSYVTPRTIYKWQQIQPNAFPSGWGNSGVSTLVTGPGGSSVNHIYFPLTALANGLLNGAKLTTVTMFMSVVNTHASGNPSNFPGFTVNAVNLIPGSPPSGAATLWSGGTLNFPSPGGSGSLWYNSGNVQTLTMTCNQNNGIGFSNTGSAYYYIDMTDEFGGAGAQSGNIYYGFVLGFSDIQSAAPY